VGIFYVLTINNIEKIYTQDTYQVVYDFKRDYIRDTVENQIAEIERLRNREVLTFQLHNALASSLLQDAAENLTEQQFIDFYTTHFSLRSQTGIWDALLWNPDTQQVYYSSDIAIDTMQQSLDLYAAYTSTQYGKLQAFYGVKQSVIDSLVKKEIYDQIHNQSFTDDTYLWVNEIVDFHGGDNYAIRKIHPNLKDTEGMYLSTSMTDIAGNSPYLEELEGINEQGELFFTYFFKRKNTNEIAEKLTFAKLYEPYNWIVAMGIHLEDMESFASEANEQSKSLTQKMVILFVGLLILLVTLSILAVMALERRKNRRDTLALKEEANRDTLTVAYNRRFGISVISRIFHQFKQGRTQSPAIFITDIDDFKRINDRYGHSVGDHALQTVAQVLTKSLRSTDQLYRWGGDEIVMVCDGIREENSMWFANNLRTAVESADISVGDAADSVTISIGISYFTAEDSSVQDVFNRADEALYRAKRSGKNRVILSSGTTEP
jgi:diguanylate cyclase (GGDEF)-like protein